MSRFAKHQAICLAIWSLLSTALPGRPLQAQRMAPVGVRLSTGNWVAGRSTPPLHFTVRRLAADSRDAERARHAVIGTAVGALAGVALGYHRGKIADASCSSECGGPRIATLIDPPIYGLLGAAVGAIIGYWLPI